MRALCGRIYFLRVRELISGQNSFPSFFPALHVALRTPCFVTANLKGLFTMSGGLTALAITVSNDNIDMVETLLMLTC